MQATTRRGLGEQWVCSGNARSHNLICPLAFFMGVQACCSLGPSASLDYTARGSGRVHGVALTKETNLTWLPDSPWVFQLVPAWKPAPTCATMFILLVAVDAHMERLQGASMGPMCAKILVVSQNFATCRA